MMELEKNDEFDESLASLTTKKDVKTSRMKKLKRNEKEKEKQSTFLPFYLQKKYHEKNFNYYYGYDYPKESIGIVIQVLGNYQFLVYDRFGIKCHASLPSSLHHHQYHGLDIGNIVKMERKELTASHFYEYFISEKVYQHDLFPHEVEKFQKYLKDNKSFKQFCKGLSGNTFVSESRDSDEEAMESVDEGEEEEGEGEGKKRGVVISVQEMQSRHFSHLFISKMIEKYPSLPPTFLSTNSSSSNTRKSLKIGITSFFLFLCTLYEIYTLDHEEEIQYITTTLLNFSPYNKIGLLLYQLFHSSFHSLPIKKIKQDHLPLELTAQIMSYFTLEDLLIYFTSFLFKDYCYVYMKDQFKHFLNLQYSGKLQLKRLFHGLRSFDKNEIHAAMKKEEVGEEEEEEEDESVSEFDDQEEYQRIVRESWYDGDHDLRDDRYRIEKFQSNKEMINNYKVIDSDLKNHLEQLLESRIPYHMSVFYFSIEFLRN